MKADPGAAPDRMVAARRFRFAARHGWRNIHATPPKRDSAMRMLALLMLCLLATSARAAESVDVALVLVADVSRSIDDSEFELQKQGYVAAFTDPKVLAAITGGMNGAISVAYVEFAGVGEVRTVIDWTTIRDAASARSFAGRLQASPRSFWGHTSISAGVDQAMQLLAETDFQAQRRVIDVSGDGTNNSGRDAGAARDDAVAAGVTINGLAIINEHPVSWAFAHVQPPGGLGNWYRENVIGGTGSFVEEVHDFHDFGEALTHKLINEISEVAPGVRRGNG